MAKKCGRVGGKARSGDWRLSEAEFDETFRLDTDADVRVARAGKRSSACEHDEKEAFADNGAGCPGEPGGSHGTRIRASQRSCAGGWCGETSACPV